MSYDWLTSPAPFCLSTTYFDGCPDKRVLVTGSTQPQQCAMVCCVAVGCSTRSGGEKMMHRFPRDPERRKIWEDKVRRLHWRAHDQSYLCSDHFDENQYEGHRADNLRKLKPNAVPTLFPNLETPKSHDSHCPPRKRYASCEEEEEEPSKMMCMDNPHSTTGDSHPSHPDEDSTGGDSDPQSPLELHDTKHDSNTSVPAQDELVASDDSDPPSDGSDDGDPLRDTRHDSDSDTSSPVQDAVLEPEPQEPHQTKATAVDQNQELEKRCEEMQKKILYLENALAEERRKNKLLEEQMSTKIKNILKVFNSDQMEKFNRENTRSPKLKVASAAARDDLSQNVPMPLEVVDTEPRILHSIFD